MSFGSGSIALSVPSCSDFRIAAVLQHVHAQRPSCIPAARLLSQRLDISQSYLRHRFKEVVGMSYGQYVRRLRFQHARILLERGDLKVKQAMLEVGMLDHSSFAKAYKRYFGESPTSTKQTSHGHSLRLLLSPVGEGASISEKIGA